MGKGHVERLPGLFILLSARFQGQNEERSSSSSDYQNRKTRSELEVIEDAK